MFVWVVIQLFVGILFGFLICGIIAGFDLEYNEKYSDNSIIKDLFIIIVGSVYFLIFNHLPSINRFGKIFLAVLWSILFCGSIIVLFIIFILISIIYSVGKLFCIIFKNRDKGETKWRYYVLKMGLLI